MRRPSPVVGRNPGSRAAAASPIGEGSNRRPSAPGDGIGDEATNQPGPAMDDTPQTLLNTAYSSLAKVPCRKESFIFVPAAKWVSTTFIPECLDRQFEAY